MTDFAEYVRDIFFTFKTMYSDQLFGRIIQHFPVDDWSFQNFPEETFRTSFWIPQNSLFLELVESFRLPSVGCLSTLPLCESSQFGPRIYQNFLRKRFRFGFTLVGMVCHIRSRKFSSCIRGVILAGFKLWDRQISNGNSWHRPSGVASIGFGAPHFKRTFFS